MTCRNNLSVFLWKELELTNYMLVELSANIVYGNPTVSSLASKIPVALYYQIIWVIFD